MKSPNRPSFLLTACLSAAILALLVAAVQRVGARTETAVQSQPSILSPVWGPNIQQWSAHIAVLADVYGLDPDFIAAVIKEESNGRVDLVSEAGAVGLMGVMPTGPGLEWRPSATELQNPAVNLRWGVGILAEVVRQSGGDVYAALAAYSGGWVQANNRVPRAYASRVLDNYGRAVAARSGQSPDIATQWTIAVEITRGHVPAEPLLVLGSRPQSGLHLLGKHIIYRSVDAAGKAYYVVAYAVPVVLAEPVNSGLAAMAVNQTSDMDLYPQVRPLADGVKTADNSPHVLMACLPTLDRLRGQASTRWFAPSNCTISDR
ncbi:MAG TPA: transglycosylase SLT domain-containing protein [Chloroflexota bacterium]|nr:transglycosylase SLT domain-containing protein [Chloroflexota bacterium]HUM67627.1 transglycosylase SLT domain-containing protein [Chloroflexota bacterium]